jgi:hypothetical protein
MHCAFCHADIDRLSAWKGSSGSLYCSEFCAEEFGLEPNTTPLPPPDAARRVERPRA